MRVCPHPYLYQKWFPCSTDHHTTNLFAFFFSKPHSHPRWEYIPFTRCALWAFFPFFSLFFSLFYFYFFLFGGLWDLVSQQDFLYVWGSVWRKCYFHLVLFQWIRRCIKTYILASVIIPRGLIDLLGLWWFPWCYLRLLHMFLIIALLP